MRYEILEHTADIGIRAFGKDLSELYVNAAFGMFGIILGKRATNSKERVTVEVDGMDAENLMVRWLSELLNMSREGWVFGGFDIKEINAQSLRAECRGERRHPALKPKTEIKLVTYHGMKVEKDEGGYKAEVIFDV